VSGARLVPRGLACGGRSSIQVPRFLYSRSTPRRGREVPSSASGVTVRAEKGIVRPCGHCHHTYDAVLAPWSRKHSSGYGGGDGKLVGGGEVKRLEVLHQLRHMETEVPSNIACPLEMAMSYQWPEWRQLQSEGCRQAEGQGTTSRKSAKLVISPARSSHDPSGAPNPGRSKKDWARGRTAAMQ
jgi:hypothetical protein